MGNGEVNQEGREVVQGISVVERSTKVKASEGGRKTINWMVEVFGVKDKGSEGGREVVNPSGETGEQRKRGGVIWGDHLQAD